MKQIKTAVVGGVLALGCLMSGGAQATVVYNTSLAPPGVFFGTGNANRNFTVDDENVVELGLSAITRYIGPIVPSPTNSDIYVAPDGLTTVAGKHGSVWGFDFSINLESSGLTLNNVHANLSLQDSFTGSNGSGFNPLVIPDNATSGNTAAQNSEALSFASIAGALGDPNFDVSVAAMYTFTLDLFRNSDNSLLASDQIVVDTVPEPSSLAVLGVGLLGLGFFEYFRRRRSLRG